MFVKTNTQERLNLYRDILALYKDIVASDLEEIGFDKNIVHVKNSIERNVDRAPLVIVSRADYQYTPRSLMFNEHMHNSNNTAYITQSHLLEYPILFECFGNTYLETENLGSLCMEAILTTGLNVVRSKSENIFGADMVAWSSVTRAEGEESKLQYCSVLGRVFIAVDGYHTIE